MSPFLDENVKPGKLPFCPSSVALPSAQYALSASHFCGKDLIHGFMLAQRWLRRVKVSPQGYFILERQRRKL